MEISFIRVLNQKWLKLNNKFYQNNSLIKPQSMPMQDKQTGYQASFPGPAIYATKDRPIRDQMEK